MPVYKYQALRKGVQMGYVMSQQVYYENMLAREIQKVMAAPNCRKNVLILATEETLALVNARDILFKKPEILIVPKAEVNHHAWFFTRLNYEVIR